MIMNFLMVGALISLIIVQEQTKFWNAFSAKQASLKFKEIVIQPILITANEALYLYLEMKNHIVGHLNFFTVRYQIRKDSVNNVKILINK